MASIEPTKSRAALMSRAYKLIPAVLFAGALAVGIIGTVAYSLRLWQYDIRVPFQYRGDTIFQLVYIKGLIQNGWPNVIKNLSAPFEFPGAAFPSLTSVDWIVIKCMSIFSNEPGALINIFWITSLVFAGWAAAYSAFQIGQSALFAFISGFLYALLPFAFLRNVGHLNLVYYLVPGICLLAVIIAGGGRGIRNPRSATAVALLLTLLQGFDYIYYSFFAVLLCAGAGLIAFARTKRLGSTKLACIGITIVIMASILNLAPALYSWHREGEPPNMDYKRLAEAEVYGAKLRRMLSPHPNNPVPILAAYAQKEAAANFPNENENETVRLGLYGGLGFLLSLAMVLRLDFWRELPDPAEQVASLSVITFLVITVGGFGAIINLISVPDIRAYNRFSVFISFFSLVIAGLWVERELLGRRPWIRLLGYLGAGLFIVLSIDDQLLASQRLLGQQSGDIARARIDREIVRDIERKFPARSAVLMLPFTSFPVQRPTGKMDDYDQGRLYIWSKRLRFSWPTFSNRQQTWVENMRRLKGREFLRAASISGFNLIWIDRYGYSDNGRQLVEEFVAAGAKLLSIDDPLLNGENGSERYAVFDITDVGRTLRSEMSNLDIEKERAELLDNLQTIWGPGFYPEEVNAAGIPFHWAKESARLILKNPIGSNANASVSFILASADSGVVRIGIDGHFKTYRSSVSGNLVSIEIALKGSQAKEITFDTSMKPMYIAGDSRTLSFYIMDIRSTIYSDKDQHLSQSRS
jgi:phosphoglycerol transferase